MASYTVKAYSINQNVSKSHFTIAVSVMGSNGLGVQNLSASNFTAHNITSETKFAVAELHSAGVPGFYRLLLRTETMANAGEYVLALVVTGRRSVAGRVPEGMDEGSTMIKLRVA
ncbi:MAG: hypothetical protein NVS9B9_26820 [Ktedonobacteraceae bacterium]